MGFPSTICRLLVARAEGSSHDQKTTESYQKYLQSLAQPDINDFDAVIAHYHDACDFRYETDPLYLTTTLGLVIDVWRSFEKAEQTAAALQEVIRAQEETLKHCEAEENKPEGYTRLLINLGKVYIILSDTNEKERTFSLVKSSEYLERALAFTAEHPECRASDETEASLTLGIASWKLCDIERRDIALNAAIARLSGAYQCQNEFFSDPLPAPQDLATAVQYLHEAIDRSPPSAQIRDTSLLHLCQALLLRYELSEDQESKCHDLIRAEAVARTAMPIVSQDVHGKFKDTLIVISDWKDQAAQVDSMHVKPSPVAPGSSMLDAGRTFCGSRASRAFPCPTSQVIFTTWALSTHPSTCVQRPTKTIAFTQSIGHRVTPPNRKPRGPRKWSVSGRNLISVSPQNQLSFGSSYHAITTHSRSRRI
ncbi:hypothetical protein JR316_0009191 [Psilocybe cubensis]|uniref:Uncharacterized protein n=2 Tax=Psilocybe cubensis TaxID=181762 RepID=A0ACB8GSU4_PSICU|nr:hypothetical protein JR316_0009191 [Psilocybe cubensis]KAH9478731.1 hypothetical protein JR316_0009191 [Psilocybe cubensis]